MTALVLATLWTTFISLVILGQSDFLLKLPKIIYIVLAIILTALISIGGIK